MPVHVMKNLYADMLTKELVNLRRRKLKELASLDPIKRRVDKQTKKKLEIHLSAIDEELAARVDLLNLFV